MAAARAARRLSRRAEALRALGLDPAAADRVHPTVCGCAREGRITPAYAIERYTPRRRRAILVATLCALERPGRGSKIFQILKFKEIQAERVLAVARKMSPNGE